MNAATSASVVSRCDAGSAMSSARWSSCAEPNLSRGFLASAFMTTASRLRGKCRLSLLGNITGVSDEML